jgi:hypothetical protein
MIVVAGGLAVLLGASLIAGSGPAGAAVVARASGGRLGCSYPPVCLYKGYGFSQPTGQFRDVTSGWQYLSRSQGATGFVNTRHDDVAYLLTSSGKTMCVRPGTNGGLIPGSGVTIRAIRISYSSQC